jgi:hypothetical protein
MSRLRFAPMLVVAALVMLGCQGKPLPPELASYAGRGAGWSWPSRPAAR